MISNKFIAILVVTQTDHFVEHANEILDDHGCTCNILLLINMQYLINKNEILDVDFTDLQKKFKVDVHNTIIYLVIQSLERRCYSKFFAVLNSVWLSPEMYANGRTK